MIFSDNYTVHEKYSVLREEHLCTYSEMPWLYTPLVDDRYNPTGIGTVTKANLNNVLDFKYLTPGNRDTIKNEYKRLGIDHDGSVIQKYYTRFKLVHACVNQERNRFIDVTGTGHLRDVYDKIDSIIIPGIGTYPEITGMVHDMYGNPEAIEITDEVYNVDSYQNEMLEKLNQYCRRNYSYSTGRLTVGEGNKVSIRMCLQYPRKVSGSGVEQVKNFESIWNNEMRENKFRVSNYQALNKHIFGMRKFGFLSADQATFIYTAMNPEHIDENNIIDMTDYRIDLEYVFDGNTLVDIIGHNVKYHQFNEIQVVTGFINADGTDSREIEVEDFLVEL